MRWIPRSDSIEMSQGYVVWTLNSRWKWWREKGIFGRMLLERADQGSRTDTLMIDATHLKTHHTASSLGLKKGGAAA